MGNTIRCYKKYYTIEKYNKPCKTCFFKCKYPPPGPPVKENIVIKYNEHNYIVKKWLQRMYKGKGLFDNFKAGMENGDCRRQK